MHFKKFCEENETLLENPGRIFVSLPSKFGNKLRSLQTPPPQYMFLTPARGNLISAIPYPVGRTFYLFRGVGITGDHMIFYGFRSSIKGAIGFSHENRGCDTCVTSIKCIFDSQIICRIYRTCIYNL